MGLIGMRFERIEKTEDHKDRPCKTTSLHLLASVKKFRINKNNRFSVRLIVF